MFNRLKINISRRIRETKMVALALLSVRHPLFAHIIPIRRCNLSCTYCNEYDHTSYPIPLDVMQKRIDHLAHLGLSSLVFSGGEPMLHRKLEDMIIHSRRNGMLTALITNGSCLTVKRINQLNEAGLDYLQISIDNVIPDEVSEKSLSLLQDKLLLLAKGALFDVNINAVIGGGIHHPEDALTIGKRATELGFSFTLGIIHDGQGQLHRLSDHERAIYNQAKKIGKKRWARFRKFQDNLVLGKPNDWKCRAGSRYLYICENGLVHYCSQQRGYPGIPLEKYTKAHLLHEFTTKKSCAPYCTIGCVHAVSLFDKLRK